MSGAAAGAAPSLAFPLPAWAFALRTWLALVLALHAAFWLELQAPASAALTVVILALPTRGQGLEKAGFRILGTVAGVAASIVLVGLFAQTGLLLLGAIAAWIALCVAAASRLEGNRAYAAALCAITVAFIAVQLLDQPGDVFMAGLARGAAVVIGMLALALVNDVLAAPDFHPQVAAKLEALRRRVLAQAARLDAGAPVPAAESAGLLQEIGGLRSGISSLAMESSNGTARSAAARTALVHLVAAATLVRALDCLDRAGPAAGPAVAQARAWTAAELAGRSRAAEQAITALRAGRAPGRPLPAPSCTSPGIAVANGAGAFLYFMTAALLLMASGWQAVEAVLAFFGILIGLSATTPDPRGFAGLAVMAAPLGCLLAGVLEFVVLDGAADFPLLAIALAPPVIGLGLLMTHRNPALAALARTVLIFTVAILGPSNPQAYDPQTYLLTCLFACLAALLLLAVQRLLPPLSPSARARCLLAEARRDLGRPLPRRFRRLGWEVWLCRNAARLGQILNASRGLPRAPEMQAEAMALLERSVALRLCEAALGRSRAASDAAAMQAARDAFEHRDGAAMQAAAHRLQAAGGDAAAVAALLLAGISLGPAGAAS